MLFLLNKHNKQPFPLSPQQAQLPRAAAAAATPDPPLEHTLAAPAQVRGVPRHTLPNNSGAIVIIVLC